MLNFDKWLLREMGHLEVRPAIGDRKPIELIDPRFEGYPAHQRHPRQTAEHPYHGRLPDGRFLVNPGRNGEAAYIHPSRPDGDSYELPDDWWDYADVFYADGSRRKPIKGRDPDLV